MEIRDLIITPIYLILIYFGAYLIRPYVTDTITRKYFIPGLTVRLIGALAIGFVYQFYYDGGDTFNFHTHGSRHIWEAFIDNPLTGLDMMLSNGEHQGHFYQYSSRIPFFQDPSSYFVIRVAGFFDLFTFSAYSSTSLFFAVFSFVGMWMLFLTFYRIYPAIHNGLAIAIFFIPSCFFWGSGLMKDTITLGCLGIATFEFYRLFFERKISVVHLGLLLLALFCLFSIKKYLLQAYLPAVIAWVYIGNYNRILPKMLRYMLLPFLVSLGLGFAYFSILKVGEGDKRYAVTRLAETAKTTALDIRFQTGREAGSGYVLGELDGTFSGMLKLAPSAINVSLFRPYLWEVNNPLMALSALESLVIFYLVIRIFFFEGGWRFGFRKNPDVVFCLIFALILAFAVGISTFNFGTLVRYKIPLLPFLIIGLSIIRYENKLKKLSRFDVTE